MTHTFGQVYYDERFKPPYTVTERKKLEDGTVVVNHHRFHSESDALIFRGIHV